MASKYVVEIDGTENLSTSSAERAVNRYRKLVGRAGSVDVVLKKDGKALSPKQVDELEEALGDDA